MWKLCRNIYPYLGLENRVELSFKEKKNATLFSPARCHTGVLWDMETAMKMDPCELGILNGCMALPNCNGLSMT